jgi:hypothetical protein
MYSTMRARIATAVLIAGAIVFSLAPSAASAASFPLTIEPAGNGSGSWECEVLAVLEPCEAEYAEGTEVTVVPEADPGSEFVEFYGDCGPLACELTMDEAHSATVVFEPEFGANEFALNILENGFGEGEVLCAEGFGLPEPCELEYPEGTELTLVAEPEEGSEFVEWAGECGNIVGNECELEMTAEKTVEVTFETASAEFALQIEEPGTGSGTIVCEAQEGPEECRAEYPEGTLLYLHAEASIGSEFVEWVGCDATPAPGECEVEMTEERTVEAVFNSIPPNEFELKVVKGGTGEGTVTSSPPGINCGPACTEEGANFPENEVVTLTASESVGSAFVGWTSLSGTPGTCVGAASPCTVTMSEAVELEAEFEEVPPEFELTVKKIGTGSGTVTSLPPGINCGPACPEEGALFPENEFVELEASEAAGSEFKGWRGADAVAEGCDTSGAIPTCEVVMTASMTIEAEFTSTTPAPTVTGVSPNHGTTAGGETITIEGTNLESVEEVKFGATAASLATLVEVSSTEIEIESPAHAAGEVDVTVKTPGGTSSTGAGDKFTYEAPAPTPTFNLKVVKSGSGSGTVTSSPAGISCGSTCEHAFNEGTVVTLSAAAASGSEFAGWSGAGCSGTGTCVVTMSANREVTASFSVKPEEEEKAGIARVGRRALVKGNKALLKLRCSGGPCRGRLKLIARVKMGKRTRNLVIGKAAFRLAAGAKRTLRVKLSSLALRELRKHKSLKAKVAGTGVARSTVKLVLVRKRRR